MCRKGRERQRKTLLGNEKREREEGNTKTTNPGRKNHLLVFVFDTEKKVKNKHF